MHMNKNQIGRLIAYVLLALVVLTASTLAFQPTGTSEAARAAPVNNLIYLPIVSKFESAYDWFQFNGDALHSGNNTFEKKLSPSNVTLLHMLFQVSLPGVADGSPVYLSNVATASGTRNLVFVTTRTGGVAALDASTGKTIWWQPSQAASCLINNNNDRNEACYTTSSPVLDPNRQFIYSYGLDGYVHKYAVGNGAEILTGRLAGVGLSKGL